ncbi:hypothetical protein PPYR_08924 [Photinus pyralis]|uniref:Prokaryotic-type class I peptide chain release factors domain-containing protein n=1 Tax=Photinus pyralis TaxID=7054 RepID=A0A1Y1K8Y0_PHOPY|nr:peptide chain release factor 1-like, mitochondrial [Photinus pyralis]KAB0797931.1 hypothetical protein PPYR_08924 [Photinus pyralis]
MFGSALELICDMLITTRRCCKSISACILNSYQHFKRSKQFYNTSSNYAVNLHVNNVNLNNYIIKLKKEYDELNSVTAALLPKQEQRLAVLQPTITILQVRNDVIDNITNLTSLLQDDDPAIRLLAEEENESFREKLKCIDEELLQTLLPLDDDDKCNAIILEVSAGVGGQEAMLFAKELFNTYCNFADYKNWNLEIAEYLTTDLGGIRHASALINGDKVLQYLKYEAGVHRVQRIPATEKAGRIHTSTVSVLVLPQPTEIQIIINPKDLRIETKRASGAGGQHVNTTDSAVRITHLPTGLSTECQVDRSQHKNKTIALQRLRALLYDKQLQSQLNKMENTKKMQVRSNFRNEKIRTYNFNQDRISDHRLQGCNIHNLKAFLCGGALLENLIIRLHNAIRIEILLDTVKRVTGLET